MILTDNATLYDRLWRPDCVIAHILYDITSDHPLHHAIGYADVSSIACGEQSFQQMTYPLMLTTRCSLLVILHSGNTPLLCCPLFQARRRGGGHLISVVESANTLVVLCRLRKFLN